MPITIKTNYMAGDNLIKTVVIYEIIEAQQTIICDLYDADNELVCHGACYWYAGSDKNIPFDWSPA